MNLPTHQQCIELFDEYKVPDNVRRHSFCVNKVAVFLARKLREKGIEIDVELVDRASLLHDLDKIPTLDKPGHGEMTEKILLEKGHHPKIGKIIKKHCFNAILDNGLETWEEKLVNYSDKKCREDSIVTLHERFEYGKKRYPHLRGPRTNEAEQLFLDFEKEVFNIIRLDPEKLKEYVENG
ncbi:MAG: HDIG domain-containing protein [Candidatus Woesearchaeota archaeon]|nr:HDIG domain-containing protein [Candidatus Woesearchaeota archaeon]